VAEFLSSFEGGPVGGEILFVKSGQDGPFDRPARWQQFEKLITNRFGHPVGRVGVFLYELVDLSPPSSGIVVWPYRYAGYGESYVPVSDGVSSPVVVPAPRQNSA